RVAAWKGEWWAYHPALAAPPAKSKNWEATGRIAAALRHALEDRDPRLRLAAVDGLRSAGETNAAERLREIFPGETDAAVRRAMAQAFGQFKDLEAAPLLVDLLKDASIGPALSSAGIDAAGQIGGASLVAALEEFVGRDNAETTLREKAIEALATLRATEAVGAVAAQLDSPRATVRAAAIRALGRLGGDTALQALRSRLNDPSPDTRRQV